MPTASADDLYWNPLDVDTGETPSSYTKHYIDPWDLENYAYIRQQLDSDDGVYYMPAKSMSTLPLAEEEEEEDIYSPRRAPQEAVYYYATKRSSRCGTYAAVEDYCSRDTRCLPRATIAGRRSRINEEEDIYNANDCNDMDFYGTTGHGSMQIYEKNKSMRHKPDGPVAKMAKLRSHSFSTTDYDYDPPYKFNHHRSYNEFRSDIYDSTGGSSSIYDDLRSGHTSFKPRHFRLGNYGHLKIDYSFSWNNLNKYIYN